MSTVQIRKGQDSRITENISESELQSGSVDAPDVFLLSKNTIDAVQFVRNLYNDPVIITSTGRTPLHNTSIRSNDSSMHLITDQRPVRAIDWRFQNPEVHAEFVRDMQGMGTEFETLRRRFGISIGLYDNFIHFDDGQGAGVNAKSIKTDEYGRFGFWDLTTTVGGKKKTSSSK